MFGLIRKRKVTDALVFIAKEYDSDKQQPGMTKLNSFYYSCGNMNCANYIWSKIGCKGPIMVNRVPQDGRSELIDRGDVLGVVSCFFKDNDIDGLADLEREINRLSTASPWNRVEERLPEPMGR